MLVLAPAGHGKTTLLGQIASRFPGTVVWYRIDAADRDPAELAGRIGRALGKAGLAGDCRSFDDVAAALDAAGRDLLLVFDDFHAVAGSEAEHGLARMIALAPPTLRVVLGARRVVGLDVPALRVYGAVHVVDADDLRFRSWEVERLFREIYHQPLPPEDAATLSQRTGGWAAGLAMFHLLTEGRPPAQRRRALADLSRGIAAGALLPRPGGARRPACRAARVPAPHQRPGRADRGPVRRAARRPPAARPSWRSWSSAGSSRPHRTTAASSATTRCCSTTSSWS